ncbi:MAG: DUF1080 domain-containing protein [Flavobacteriaceae bacterium]|nr:DUF1080 domain-containing protein [Flavobacteriaceae bacterium]
MKNTILVACIIMVVTISCKKEKSESDVAQDTTEQASETETKNEWIALFDGSSLDNWKGYLSDSLYNEWSIDGDAMKFTPGEKGGKNIISKQKFTNFVLSLEWKISEKGNSGIFWGVYEDEKFPEAYETGPEIQVLDNERHPDSFVAEGTHKAGSLYDMIACPPELVNPAGEWNECILKIDHENNIGSVTMNGKEAFTFAVHGEKWDEMVANSKFKDWEGFGKYKEGHIGLQDHSDIVWYRNIKIKEL